MKKNMTKISFENISKLKSNHKLLKESRYLPKYHIFPFSGLINDPNGFHFDGEKYQIFFQWHPWGATHGLKYWYHLSTTDFINYENHSWPLEPNEEFANRGVYSGTARLAENGNSEIIYTANHYINDIRYPAQMIAQMKNNEIIEQKIAIEPNQEFTEHFRDPKVFIDKKSEKYVSIGAQTKTKKGTVAVYKEINSSFEYLGKLYISEELNNYGYMWECPDITLDINKENQGLFVFCPQGITNEDFPNIYSATYLVFDEFSEADLALKNTSQVKLIDNGFDFYAPQITFDQSKNRYLMYAWVGLPDIEYPTDEENWSGLLSLPREIKVENRQMLQKPISEITNLYESIEAISSNCFELFNGKLNLEINEGFELKIGNENDYLKLYEEDGYLYLSRSNLIKQFAQDYGLTRKVKIVSNQLEIYIDQSIIEVFVNPVDDFYENTLTARFFLKEIENDINVKNIKNGTKFKMKGIDLNYDK
jgi:beta-fructofuranosidase